MQNFKELCEDLRVAGYEFYRRGWVLGTSGNFSAREFRKTSANLLTASGNDKGELDETHFLEIDDNADVFQGFGTPSAETMLHLTIYRVKNTGAILHTHSVWGTILSDIVMRTAQSKSKVTRCSKAERRENARTPRTRPRVENSQDYIALSHVIENVIRENPKIHGIYLRRHGLYTWGETIAEARRHIEIFEFLVEVLGRTQETEYRR